MLRICFWSVMLWGLLVGSSVRGAAIIETFNANLAIPDGNPSGASDTQPVATTLAQITELSVSLDIAAGYNGDLYAYLRHGNQWAVLLTRPGRSTSDATGYADSGFRVTLSDSAANGDMHFYQLMGTPAAGQPLTGIWQPDARPVDPDLVDNGGRTSTATLSAFNGMDPNGDWTLFVADMNSGGAVVLNSWTLELTGVPEPQTYALVAAIGLIGYGVFRRWFQS